MKLANATPEKGLYVSLRLDGRVRASGTGSPPWERFVAQLAPLSGLFCHSLELAVTYVNEYGGTMGSRVPGFMQCLALSSKSSKLHCREALPDTVEVHPVSLPSQASS